MIRLFLIFWLLCLCSFYSNANTSPLLLPLSSEQGLSQGTVQTMFIDKQGFLWVGTSNGLNSYDGTQVKHFLPSTHAFKDLSIVEIEEDELSRFWVAASNYGIFQLNRAKGSVELVFDLTAQENLSRAMISDFIVEDADHLLLAIQQKVYRFNIHNKQLVKLYEYAGEGSARTWIMQVIKHEQQVFIASSKGLIRLDLRTGRHELLRLSERDSPIYTMLKTNQQLWVAQNNAIYTVNLADVSQRQKRVDQLRALDLVQDGEMLMIASDKGLYRLDTQHNDPELVLRFSQSGQNIGDDMITRLIQSPDGGYWLASRDEGAFYWHPNTGLFQSIPITPISKTTSSFNIRGASALGVDSHDVVWVGNSDGIKSVDFNHDQVTPYPFPNPLPSNFRNNITRIYPDAHGNLWLRAALALHYYSPTTAQFLPLPLKDPTQAPLFQEVLGVWYSPQNDFWFFNKDDYYHYQPTTGAIRPLPGLKDQLPTDRARKIIGTLPNHPEILVIGAADQVWTYNINTEVATLVYQMTPYLPLLDRFAHDMAIDRDQVLWMAFDGVGLLGFELPSFRLKHQFNSSDLLLTNNIHGLEQDSTGNLWLSSNSGLFRFDPQNLRIEHFSKKEGLASNQFSFAASGRLGNGDLVFGDSRGVTRFNPIALAELPKAPTVVITSLQALNQPSASTFTDISGESFVFDAKAKGLKVEFSSLNFRDQAKISYKFWIDGRQSLAYPEQKTPSVIFPELPAGSYTLNVQAISQSTGLASKVASLQIKILPQPWLSSAAIASYGTIGLLLLSLWQYNRHVNKRLLASAQSKVHTSELRLKQALDAVNSGVWEWHVRKNHLFGQRIHSMLGYNEELNPISVTQHSLLIHPEDRDGYQQAWQKFLSAMDRSFDHTYRMQHKDGHWLWFRDIGKITEFDHQQAIRVIGTYSNITESRATKEKARLFGEAFQQTRDWVVLLDPEQRVIAANQSFTDVFGNMDDYLTKPQKHDLGISLNRRRFYIRLLAGMTASQHWQGEELVTSPDGTERPTLINVSAVGEASQVEFFVLVFTDITAQKQAEENLRYLANYDALTGLPNRSLLMDRIHHGIDQAKREQRSLALCFIDLDKFKQVNDSLGHDVGDLLLKQVAKRLTNTLRLTDTVARLGGDEFVVLLESYKDDNNVSHVARKMLKAIAEPMQLGNHTVSVSPSIGIALYPEDAADARELLKHADVAMYSAKDSGRNNFQFFIQDMNDKAHMQLARETRLRSAWQHDEFFNFYQPIYDSRSQQMVGVEVLMRWQSADQSVPPSDFIPLAEDLRLIVPMTQALLIRALSDLQQWHQQGFMLYVSVNLSPRHLEQEDLAEETAALLAKYQIPAHCLRFEVTESALMQDHQSAIETMLALSALGVQLALDDFGTGYSSLKYLKELPIDAIKIDRSFVKDIGIDRNDETIIDAMLSMANSLGMYCIAEGVETEQQLAFFSKRQCYFIQGYLFGKPMNAQQLLDKLRTETHM